MKQWDRHISVVESIAVGVDSRRDLFLRIYIQSIIFKISTKTHVWIVQQGIGGFT